MNKCIFIGNLTRDPEFQTTDNGISLCRFSIAVNRNYTTADGEREADFINIVAWRGLAENCYKYLTKGKKVCVVGQYQSRKWTDDEGKSRMITEIVATDIEFLTPPSALSSEGRETARRDETPAKSSYKPNKQQAADNGYDPAYDDDLPF